MQSDRDRRLGVFECLHGIDVTVGRVTTARLKEWRSGFEQSLKVEHVNNDQAMGLLTKQEELLNNFVAAKTKELETIKDGWRSEVINDEILGGGNLKTTIEQARRTVEKFATPEFKEMLRETGYGDNIEVVRFFSKIGAMMQDDTIVTGSEFAGEKPVEDYFYGN